MEKLELNSDQIQKAAELLKAVAHPLRLKIVKLINEKGEVNVNVIYNTLKIEQSITSQHLKMLRGVEAVDTRRDEKKIYYTLNAERFNILSRAVAVVDEYKSKAPAKKKATK